MGRVVAHGQKVGGCGSIGYSAKERLRHSAGSSAPATEGQQEANDHQAGNVRICQVHDGIHDLLRRFDGGRSLILWFALAN